MTNFNEVTPVLLEVLVDRTCDAAPLAQHKLRNEIDSGQVIFGSAGVPARNSEGLQGASFPSCRPPRGPPTG